MAVRIDIRPRLTLRDEPKAKVRRGVRLPPLTLPSVAYWLAMGGLTYFFAHLENPLGSAAVAEASPPREPAPALEPAPIEAAPEPVAAPAPPIASPSEPPPNEETEAPSELAEREQPQPEDRRPETRSERREAAEAASEAPAVVAAAPAPRLEFPEFTDSSRPRRAERAADGPRIDGLFERREERERSEEPSPATPPPKTDEAPAVVTSCEAAIARNNEQLTLGAPRGPVDITRDQYAAILQNGRYLSGCSLPERTVFEICAAVRNGRAVGITVTSNPPSSSLNACVRRAVSRLEFPANPKLDVTHTRFDAVSR